jgi:CheY-like chemotaxis protein
MKLIDLPSISLTLKNMFKGKMVLVIDDESDLREILRDELLYERAQVMEASNGKEAFELLQKHQFDVILSDIRMPGGDGVTLAKKWREQHPASPVLVLITGFADLRSEEAYSLGADGYMPKPFRLDELKETLERLLLKPPQRWLTASPASANVRTLDVPMTLAQCLQTGEVHVGRGGIFLRGNPAHLGVGEKIKVHFQDFEVLGCVRWQRGEAQGNLPAGLGLEFWQMTAQNFATFCQEVPESELNGLRSYIPAS